MTFTPLHSKDPAQELAYLKSPNWKKVPFRAYYCWEDKGKYVGAGPWLSAEERTGRLAQCEVEIAAKKVGLP